LSRVRTDSFTEFFGGLCSGCHQSQGQEQQQFNLKHVMLICKVFILIQRLGYQVHKQGLFGGRFKPVFLSLCETAAR